MADRSNERRILRRSQFKARWRWFNEHPLCDPWLDGAEWFRLIYEFPERNMTDEEMAGDLPAVVPPVRGL